MAKLKNIGPDPVLMYKSDPAHPDSLLVEAGQVLEVPGEVAEAGDAYVIGEGDAARAFPKSRWSLVAPKKPAEKE